MSYPARQWLLWYAKAEHEVEWWLGYPDRLTVEERRRLGRGEFHSLKRPWLPEFKTGAQVEVSKNLLITIGEPVFRRGFYRIPITQVHDHRVNRLHMRHIREDAEGMTTIVPVNDVPPNPPEPERIPQGEVEATPTTVAARARYAREWQERRLNHEAQPLEVRLAHLREEAARAGVDVTRQLTRIEQGIKAAESKVRRLAESASDRAA